MKILFLFLLLPFYSLGQTPMSMLIDGVTASGITPPTFVSETETAWNTTTSPKTTASISVNTGDIIVAYGMCENHQSALTISGGSLTWTQQQVILVTNFCWASIWTTTATSTTSFTVSFTRTGSAIDFGGDVLVFRNSAGIGASSKTNVAGGAPSLTLTTLANNSAVVCINGDFAALATSRTWRTVNSITPTSGNGLEQTYQAVGSNYTVYGAYWNNVGTAGSKTFGLSAPTGQTYSIISCEVKGQ